MRETKLLIVLTISAGVLSCLLYRAVVNAPKPREARPVKKAGSLQGPVPLEMGAPVSLPAEPSQVAVTQGEASGNVQQKADPFAGSKKLSPEETKRVFEDSMKAHTTASKDTEKAFTDSIQKGRSEKMSDKEKEDAFQRSMGSGMSDAERQEQFKKSMGIK